MGNTATTNGNVIATYDSPAISMINTYLDDPINTNNFNEAGTATTWNTCTSTNPCTEIPFTGTCTDSNNGNAKLGVQCQATCSPNKPYYYSKGVIAGCSATVREWDCGAGRNEGSYTRSSDCTIGGTTTTNGGGVVVSGTLEIVGNNSDMSNLITITAANNQRHFYLNGINDVLTLRYVKLTGGASDNGGSISIYSNGGKLNTYFTIFSNNYASVSGGAVYAWATALINKVVLKI